MLERCHFTCYTHFCAHQAISFFLTFDLLRCSIWCSLGFQIVFCRHSTKWHSAQKKNTTGCDKLISFVHSKDLCLPCLYNTVINYNMHVFNFHHVFLFSGNPPLSQCLFCQIRSNVCIWRKKNVLHKQSFILPKMCFFPNLFVAIWYSLYKGLSWHEYLEDTENTQKSFW